MAQEAQGQCLVEGERGPLVERRVLLFRRLEPGDAHTPGALPMPESPHLEALVRRIGIGAPLLAEMERLYAARDAILERREKTPLSTYEPAGVLLSIAFALSFGGWLDYLPGPAIYAGAGVAAIGLLLGVVTRVRRDSLERSLLEAWEAAPEREAYQALVERVEEAWARFSRSAQAQGFRTEIRLGSEGKGLDRLATMDKNDWLAPPMWRPDPEGALRYEAVYPSGLSVERVLPAAEPFLPTDSDENSEITTNSEEE